MGVGGDVARSSKHRPLWNKSVSTRLISVA